MGIVDAIKKGFGVASKNLTLILVLFVFNLIWNMVNVAIMPAGAVPVPGATPDTTPPAVAPGVAIASLLASIVFILASIFMQGGSLAVVRDYIKEGKMKLGSFASYGLKYYIRLLGLGILIVLIVVIIALIAALIIAATAPLNNMIATIIASIIAIAIGLAGIYLVLLLVMAPYSLVCDNTGVIEAIKKSMGVVKKNFMKVLLLLVLLVLIAIGIGVLIGIVTGIATVAMPAKVGQIVIGIVNSLFNGYLGVVMMAAFMGYYLALSGKEKVAA